MVDFLEFRKTVFGPAEHVSAKSDRSLLAFVVRHGHDGAQVDLLDLGPVAPLSEAIDTWRKTFGTSAPGARAGQLLREKIWAPVEQHLQGTKLVLVSVDGVLGRLPLGALPGKEPGKYLLEGPSACDSTSAPVVAGAGQRPGPQGTLRRIAADGRCGLRR